MRALLRLERKRNIYYFLVLFYMLCVFLLYYFNFYCVTFKFHPTKENPLVLTAYQFFRKPQFVTPDQERQCLWEYWIKSFHCLLALVFLICDRKPGTPASLLWSVGPVSRNSRDLSGLFRMPQFLLYLRNTEVLRH